MKNIEQIINDGLKENPDVRLVLEIAARAREIEARETPRELWTSTEVATTPTNPQTAV
jgi:hypothetical protein